MTKPILIISLILILFTPLAVAQRIVSLVPSATFAAVQLGADANIVGRTSFCPKPTNGVASQVVGDVLTVNTEAIVSLRPDAVIASPFTQKKVVQRLKALNIKVHQLPTPTSFSEICSQNIEVGMLTGHESEALTLNRSQSLAIDSICQSFKPAKPLNAYVQIGARPTWGATPDYYINDILLRLGLSNVLKEGEGSCSREAVMLRKPDVVIVSTMGGLGNEQLSMWQKTPGVKTILVDEIALGCPTPLFFRQALEHICNALKK
ncbi:MAG: ABC transporter substrate-binding protein [Bacteroidales bacterium]|nr:ABC transporter substrate-binding protein [Bacteroidales bacterium]